MGCDIHLYVEVKTEDGWEAYRDDIENPEYDPEGWEWQNHKTLNQFKPKYKLCEDEEFVISDVFYTGRNYNLFAILADVRNGYGFAGVDMGDGFVPILGFENPTRGLPDDVSLEIKRECDSWGCDGHSHSWLTVQELLEYDWQRKTNQRGMVSLGYYKELKESDTERPLSYSGSVSGRNIATVGQRFADAILDGTLSPNDDGRIAGKDLYVKMQWKSTYRDAVGDFFFDKTLPLLQSVGNPSDVRIVFWFDN